MSTPAISIVVPTRDRPDALQRCLAALGAQTAPAVEVIVVDDGSADAADVGAVVATAGSLARLVRKYGAGPAAARNAGVRAARGAVVCFTDDDCVPGPHWAERLAQACEAGQAAAGTTVADPAAGRAAAASQLLTNTLQLDSLHPRDGALGFAPTCNLACAVELARTLPFDESFALAAGEDRDWCTRLAATGAVLRHVPGAVVIHRPQLDLRGLLHQQHRYGRGAVHFRGGGGGRGRLAGPSFYRRLAREAARTGAGAAALVTLAQVAATAGAAEELVRRRRRR